MKECKRCKISKPLDEFRIIDKYYYCYCRVCERELVKEWQKNNPEKVKKTARKSGKKYRLNNPEKRKESVKKSYYKNIDRSRESGRERAKRWRENNRENFLASLKKYRETHKDD